MTVETFWQAGAIAAPATVPLAGDLRVETLVIGAGFTGLNAALELAERGREVAVIDALPLAAGASGRSGGFVSARFRMSPDRIRRRYGAAMVETMRQLSVDAVRQVGENVDRYGLEGTALKPYGSISAALNERHLNRLLANLQNGFGGRQSAQILSREQIAEVTGSARFVGGTLAPSVLGIHPLNYLYGLASAALGLGIPIHTETTARTLRTDRDGAVVETPSGTIRAGQVIMAANAYSYLTGATRPLAQGVVPFRSAVIATAPLPADQLRRVLPGGQMMVDTRRLLRWFRLLDGRLLIGGRGAGHPRHDDLAYARLQDYLLEVYPQLATVPIDWRWSGYVGLTLDRLPHVGRVSDQVLIAGGYNGNGVALSSFSGRLVARYAMGEPPETGLMDAAHMRRMPLHRLSAPGVRLAAGWFELLDRAGV